MIPKLVDYLNQTVLVSIPALQSDAKCRSYMLLGVEMQGLWLQDEKLVGELTSLTKGMSVDSQAPVFVPFAAIAFVVLPAPVTKVVDVQALTHGRPMPVEPARPERPAHDRVSTHKKRPRK
jgi:hypothetical protein